MAEFASALSPQDLATGGVTPDFAGNYGKGQQTVVNNQNIATGNRTAAAAAALPAALSAYKAGDESAIAQIAQANPEEAQALLNMKKTQQEAPLIGAQASALQAETAQKKIETQKMIQDVHLQGLVKEGAYAGNLSTALAGIEDPAQKAKIWAQYAKDAKAQGIDVHPELANWSADNEGHLKTIAAMGQQAGQIRSLMNPSPEMQEFNNVKAMSPEDQQKYMAVKSGNPMMIGMTGGAPAAPAVGPDGKPLPGVAAGQPAVMTPEENADKARGLNPEVLHQMPAPIASQVKALAEGRMTFPSGFALKSQYWQQMVSAVAQYDPSFDTVNANARAKTRADFTSGKSAQNITSMNTAMGHLESLSKAYEGLDNGSMPLVNTIENAVGGAVGNDKIQKGVADVGTKAEAVSNELAKVFRSTGMSAQEVNEWRDKISTSASPTQSKTVIKGAIELLNSRLDALAEQYNQGMGTTKQGIELLSPKAQEAYTKLTGAAPTITKTGDAAHGAGAAGGGVLHVDKNGNKAMVFPDGHFEEVK